MATVNVNGVCIDGDTFAQLINAVTRPDPRKWYRFERVGDSIIVHVKISEEGSYGQPIADIGRSQRGAENTGG